jgi:hypothetical protein
MSFRESLVGQGSEWASVSAKAGVAEPMVPMKPVSVIGKALTNESGVETLAAGKQDESTTGATGEAVGVSVAKVPVPPAESVPTAIVVPQPVQMLKPVAVEQASPVVVVDRKIVKVAVGVAPAKESVDVKDVKKDAPGTKAAVAGKSEKAEGLTQAPVAMEMPVASQNVAPAVVVAQAPLLEVTAIASGMVKRPDAAVVGENKVAVKDGRKVAGPASRLEAGPKREVVAAAGGAPVSELRVGDGVQRPAAHVFAEAAVHAVAGVAATSVGTQAVVAPATAPVVAASVAGAPVRGSVGGHPASGVHASADGDGASAGMGASDTRTLVATPNVLEVGIIGGAHGWLRVRAEMGHTGEVTASLVASNAGSAETLHKELGAMTAYLKSESVGVSSLTVTAPEKNAGTQAAVTYGSGSGAGYGAGFGSGASGQGGRRDSESFAGKPDAAKVWDEAAMASGFAGGMVPAGMLGGTSGGWLSVRV